MADRVLLLMPTATYKATDFLAAAEKLGVEVIVGSDRRQALEDEAPGRTLALDFLEPQRSVTRITQLGDAGALRAVVGTDDETTLLAAAAAAALGLPHNPLEAVRAARDKHETRRLLAAAGLPGPTFARVALDAEPAAAAAGAPYPCVLKPLGLSASRGVLRADDAAQFVAAFARIRAILAQPDVRGKGGDAQHLLVEEYIPGAEVALEGLLARGELRVLALFDKPDPLEGPTFEETLYVTPSRRPDATQAAIAAEVQAGCRALGLREGPVHAELRLPGGLPWLLELAPRTIGGLCSRTLRFGAGVSLEELILRHALGRGTGELVRERSASGVMMIPVPRAGRLRAVDGLEAARAVPGVEGVTITIPLGGEVVPLPEGHRYLGFIFARDASPAAVEAALRQAHARLRFELD
ncbi:MAG TPA: ATP-grasp domain-containing protein [Candidatus Polarisedimenticolaceae bacterium]|nr:ATP-grasp domain-containing protein [Candidatus Polarisedimenticolaceae bacterium]